MVWDFGPILWWLHSREQTFSWNSSCLSVTWLSHMQPEGRSEQELVLMNLTCGQQNTSTRSTSVSINDTWAQQPSGFAKTKHAKLILSSFPSIPLVLPPQDENWWCISSDSNFLCVSSDECRPFYLFLLLSIDSRSMALTCPHRSLWAHF